MSPHVLRAIGHAAMDAQHQLLMNLLQRLVMILKEAGADTRFLAACQEFQATLITHFAAEEASLKDAGYVHLDDHRTKHGLIVDKIRDSINALTLVNSASAKFAIINEIEDALYEHEIVEDCDYSGVAHQFPDSYNWTPDLTVGIAWIDDQHKGLFSMAKVLGEQVRSENWEAARFVYGRLLDHIRKHFDDEEMHLSHMGADVLSHRRSHLHAILALSEVIEDGNTNSLRRVEEFIFHWLRQHILADDLGDLTADGL